MKSRRKLFFYILFAIIASVSNLLIQRFILSINQSNFFFLLALVMGTLFGLIIKYFLDKKWIFLDKTRGIKSQSIKFGFYSLMGIASTLIFWGTETIFWIIWQKENMREVGALIGLSFGYSIKYRLDKRFVFNQR